MRLLDAAFDVLRRAGEPLSPAEIVRQIKSARIPIDTNEPIDDESVKGRTRARRRGRRRNPRHCTHSIRSVHAAIDAGSDPEDWNVDRDYDGVNDQPDQHRFRHRAVERRRRVVATRRHQRGVESGEASTEHQ